MDGDRLDRIARHLSHVPPLFSGETFGTVGLRRRRLLAGLAAAVLAGVRGATDAAAQSQPCTAANCPAGCCDGSAICRSLGGDASCTRAGNGACVACGPGASCAPVGGAPACVVPNPPDPPDPCAAAGLTACGGACVDLGRSRRHCGQCGRRCRRGTRCRNGRCKR